MDIATLWSLLEAGKTVYWANTGYKVYIEEVDMQGNPGTVDFQTKHHTFKDGKVLSVRFIESYWGGLLDEREMSALFVEGTEAPVLPDPFANFGKRA